MAFASPIANLFANAVKRSREEQAHVTSEPDCPDDSPVAEGEPEILALEFIPRSRNGKRALHQSGRLDENLVENIDETHFLINMDNGRTLGFRGDTQVKYANVWLDNAPGHNQTPEIEQALCDIKYEVRQFPESITHLVQPADSFIIRKIKDSWTRRWELKRMELITNSEWQGDGTRWTSGALKNPGKHYFLQLAVDLVADVNSQRGANGLSYARKAMIRCGLSLNINGRWEECQLQPE
ncbi:hypothetical protein R1sor_026269 [Riccia sorocarpa]|uniref:Uncharacterized protein n=1 Tax=Riccia sorocarpa TaxID=122646 RepID=A0ABD3GCI4_9MARC